MIRNIGKVALAALAASSLLSGCIWFISLEGAKCPCAAGFVCCQSTQVCVRDLSQCSSQPPVNPDAGSPYEAVYPPIRWWTELQQPFTEFRSPYLLADRSGNRYVIAQTVNTGFELLVQKRNLDGTLVWEKRFPQAVLGNGFVAVDSGNAMGNPIPCPPRVDDGGNILLSGFIAVQPAVAKLSSDGALVWARPTEPGCITSISASGSFVIPSPAPDYQPTKYSVYRSDGTLAWSHPLANQLSSAIINRLDQVVMADGVGSDSAAGTQISLVLADGTPGWTKLSEHFWGRPVGVTDAGLIIGGGSASAQVRYDGVDVSLPNDLFLFAIDSSGALVWTRPIPGCSPLSITPTGRALLLCDLHTLRVLDPDGTVRASFGWPKPGVEGAPFDRSMKQLAPNGDLLLTVATRGQFGIGDVGFTPYDSVSPFLIDLMMP